MLLFGGPGSPRNSCCWLAVVLQGWLAGSDLESIGRALLPLLWPLLDISFLQLQSAAVIDQNECGMGEVWTCASAASSLSMGTVGVNAGVNEHKPYRDTHHTTKQKQQNGQ